MTKTKGAPLEIGHLYPSAPSGKRHNHCLYCLKQLPASKSRNRKKEKEYCNRTCKDAFGTEARGVGRRVMVVVPERVDRDVLLADIERIGTGGIAVYDRNVQVVKKKRPEQIDLGRMTPQERLGAFCRAAERMGVMK